MSLLECVEGKCDLKKENPILQLIGLSQHFC